MNDPINDRMKEYYENRTRYYLPRRTYTIIRLDGCHFHTYTKGLNKPFDKGLSEDIDNSIIKLLSEIQGAVFAYTQSDEISILLTDFNTIQTNSWFNGNLQKIVSVSASMMSSEFNRLRMIRELKEIQPPGMFNHGHASNIQEIRMAYFDSRSFTIPDRIEVMNYFRSRQQDCIRNSVSMVAQTKFSQKELHGKSQSDMHEMFCQKGVNWATDFTDGEKNGRVIIKEEYRPEKEQLTFDLIDPISLSIKTRWISKNSWVFTKDEGKLLAMVPKYEND